MALLIIGFASGGCSADRLVFAASILCRSVFPADHRDDGRDIGTSLRRKLLSAPHHTVSSIWPSVAALGFSITNILLILGLAALVRPFTVHLVFYVAGTPLMLLLA